MLPRAEKAFFLIADISGYTRFLAAAELEHAQDIIADLMGVIVKALKPPFRLAKFEGDAVFLYLSGESADGAAVIDAIDAAYLAFRRRLRDVRQASSCACQACAAMAMLDLKFVLHHGAMVRQRVAGREELAGRDVILVHRLLKNDAKPALGGHAYALMTDDAIRALGIDSAGFGLRAHAETVDQIGAVPAGLRDMETVWRGEQERRRFVVAPEDAHVVWTFDLAGAPQAVWEHLTVPGARQGWWPSDGIAETSPGGRRGIGTITHCMHGKDAVVEEVLDWQPPSYVTVGIQLPVPGAPRIVMTRFLQASATGTRLEMRIARPRPKDRDLVNQAGARFHTAITASLQTLQAMLAAQATEPAAVAEPATPVAGGRFLAVPVRPTGA